MHAFFVLRVPEVLQVSLYFPPLVQGKIPLIFNSFLVLRICWISDTNSSQPSRMVTLRFFDSPLLFFFSMRCL